MTDAPGPLLDGFADEKGGAGSALAVHFEETIGTAAVGAENEYAFGGARYVGCDGWHAVNNGGREVAERGCEKEHGRRTRGGFLHVKDGDDERCVKQHTEKRRPTTRGQHVDWVLDRRVR